MNQHWRQISSGEANNDDDNKVGLTDMNGKGIICFKCGEEGHKASNCPENGKGAAMKDKRTCFGCGKVGHIAPKCWEDDKNASKRPANWKSSRVASETAASATDSGSRFEYLLCGMCFENDVELLNDPNIWVADTAATVHSSPHKVGMRNAKQASKMDSVRMGNGADVDATTIAQIPGVVCNKDCCELKEVVLDNVTHLPGKPSSTYLIF
jgi:hypothetical protein